MYYSLHLFLLVTQLLPVAFSETTLGRFLQAVELYLLILFLLIAAFYKAPAISRSGRSRRSKGTSSFAGLREKPRESAFQVESEEPKRDGFFIGRAFSSADEAERRESAVSRIGSWILPRATRRPASPRERFGDRDPEQGFVSDVQQTAPATIDIRSPRVEASREIEARPPDSPVPAIQVVPAQPSNETPPNRPITEISLSSYYGMERPSRFSFPNASFMSNTRREGSDSPVYGLNGIIAQNPNRISKDSVSRGRSGRSSMSSFDELLRQQTELDKSIAALRLFSPEAAMAFPESPKTPTPVKPPPVNRILSSSTNSTGQRLDSASGRSDFSLSIFPEPPTAGERNSTVTSRSQRASRTSRSGLRMPLEDLPSMPSSPNQPGTTARFDSAGTQYEITSFIGDLSVPGAGGQRPLSTFTKGLSDVESEDETPTIMTTNTIQTLRPILLGSAMPSVTSIPPMGPATASSGLMTAPANRESMSVQPMLRPFILGSAAPGLPPSRTPGMVPIGPRVRGRSSSAATLRPRLNISGPRPQDGDQAPGAFERPRPPPLILAQSRSTMPNDQR